MFGRLKDYRRSAWLFFSPLKYEVMAPSPRGKIHIFKKHREWDMKMRETRIHGGK
jgi:hypothetical protein